MSNSNVKKFLAPDRSTLETSVASIKLLLFVMETLALASIFQLLHS